MGTVLYKALAILLDHPPDEHHRRNRLLRRRRPGMPVDMPSYDPFHGEIFDNFIPWLVEGIRDYGSRGDAHHPGAGQAFGNLRSLIEMDDEERVAGRCGPGRNRQAWGALFDDVFAPHQAAITAAVLQSPSFVEACCRTAALVLPGQTIPAPVLTRWRLPFWKWPASPG